MKKVLQLIALAELAVLAPICGYAFVMFPPERVTVLVSAGMGAVSVISFATGRVVNAGTKNRYEDGNEAAFWFGQGIYMVSSAAFLIVAFKAS